jgi:hypothetical protein
MIANRYLQRDYRLLTQGDIKVENRLFSLEDTVVKYEDFQETHGPVLTIHDYINIAKEGNEVSVDVGLECVPGVAYFINHKNSQIFMMGDLTVTCLGSKHLCQRCLACYSAGREQDEKEAKMKVANDRLEILYSEFDEASVGYKRRFFEF